MEEASPARAGLAIVRVWVEVGSRQVRARLTTIDDVAEGPGTVRWTGVGTDAVVANVRVWLDEWRSAGS